MFLYILGLILCYLFGAVPFGYLIAKARGIDIREHGSGNIGATNVGRALGRQWFFVVFALDFLKGMACVALLFPLLNAGGQANLQVTYGFAGILGHMFPVYLGFRGGKGMATSSGVFSYLAHFPFLAGLAVWVIVFAALRYVSLASICGVAIFTASYFIFPARYGGYASNQVLLTISCCAITVLVIIMHRRNIARLLAGEELRM